MYPRILIAVDGSAASAGALHDGVGLARTLGSIVVLLHVVDSYPLMLSKLGQARFEEALEALQERGRQALGDAQQVAEQAGVPCEAVLHEVMNGQVAGVILEEAERQHCGLIVLGAQGRNGRTRLALGSDADIVIRCARVPVLLVRERPSLPKAAAG